MAEEFNHAGLAQPAYSGLRDYRRSRTTAGSQNLSSIRWLNGTFWVGVCLPVAFLAVLLRNETLETFWASSLFLLLVTGGPFFVSLGRLAGRLKRRWLVWVGLTLLTLPIGPFVSYVRMRELSRPGASKSTEGDARRSRLGFQMFHPAHGLLRRTLVVLAGVMLLSVGALCAYDISRDGFIPRHRISTLEEYQLAILLNGEASAWDRMQQHLAVYFILGGAFVALLGVAVAAAGRSDGAQAQ